MCNKNLKNPDGLIQKDEQYNLKYKYKWIIYSVYKYTNI